MNKHRLGMILTAMAGVTFFCVANFTDFFRAANVIASILQFSINISTFYVWTKAFLDAPTLQSRLFSLFGVLGPIVMATITLIRVILR